MKKLYYVIVGILCIYPILLAQVPKPGSGGSSSGGASKCSQLSDAASSCSVKPYHSIPFTIDGGGLPITAGQAVVGQLGNDSCTINGWSLIGKEASGSITIELDAHSSSAPNAAPSVPNTTTDKISASAPMSISSAQTAAGGATQVSSWITSRVAWDVFAINITSVTTFTHVIGEIWCQ